MLLAMRGAFTCRTGLTTTTNDVKKWTEAAHFAIRHHDGAKRFYQRKKSKTNGIIAVRGLAHKLARDSYYVMRDRWSPTR